MPTPKPLSLVEQLAYTDGGCALFAQAAARLVPARHARLFCDDPDVLERHDYPPDEPMEVHEFLLLPDGQALDAEGVRSVAALCQGFGLDPSTMDEYVEIKCSPQPPPVSAARAVLVDRLEQRLRDLGWNLAQPPARDRLASETAFRRARRELDDWWPKWEKDGTLPRSESAAAPARKARPGP